MPVMPGLELIKIMQSGTMDPDSVLLFSATMAQGTQDEAIRDLGIGRVSKGTSPQVFLSDVIAALQRTGCTVPARAIALAALVAPDRPSAAPSRLGQLTRHF